MVDVCVADNDRVDLMRVKREVPVALPGLFAAALVQPAVEQNLVIAGFQQVHGASNATSRTPEGERRFRNGVPFVEWRSCSSEYSTGRTAKHKAGYKGNIRRLASAA